jgi:hypothetical protein
MKIRVIKHEAVPDCGSFEVRFPDGRPSNVAEQDAKKFAREEQDKLDSQRD